MPLVTHSLAGLARLRWLVLLGLTLFAYRALLPDLQAWPSRQGFEDWLFAPESKTPLLALAVAGWLVWRRLPRLRALPEATAPKTSAALLAAGAGLYLWTLAHDGVLLLLLSLASNLLALAGATKGHAGLRVLLLPAAVMLLGAPIPAPIREELVWQLQLLTTSAASLVLRVAGVDVLRSGIEIGRGPYTFTVVAACCGLRAVEIFTLAAFVVRERFAAAGIRAWLPVLVAPALALALNLARIVVVVLVASSGAPRPPDTGIANHVLQGVAMLLAGAAVLYGLGRWPSGSAPGPAGDGEPAPGAAGPWRLAALGLAGLGALSMVGAPPVRPSEPPDLALPRHQSGWRGTELRVDRAFVGPVPSGWAVHRRYQRAVPDARPEVVELFVVFEAVGRPGASGIFSSRAAVPGRKWSATSAGRRHIAPLALDADLARASHDGGQAVACSWRLRDQGAWRETARSALGLDSGPFRRPSRRAVVRLVTPLRDGGTEAWELALETLDRFIRDFEQELARL